MATFSWWDGVSIWDSVSGKKITAINGDGDQLIDVAFSPDGKFLAGGLNTNKAVMLEINHHFAPFAFRGLRGLASDAWGFKNSKYA